MQALHASAESSFRLGQDSSFYYEVEEHLGTAYERALATKYGPSTGVVRYEKTRDKTLSG